MLEFASPLLLTSSFFLLQRAEKGLEYQYPMPTMPTPNEVRIRLSLLTNITSKPSGVCFNIHLLLIFLFLCKSTYRNLICWVPTSSCTDCGCSFPLTRTCWGRFAMTNACLSAIPHPSFFTCFTAIFLIVVRKLIIFGLYG